MTALVIILILTLIWEGGITAKLRQRVSDLEQELEELKDDYEDKSEDKDGE